MDTGNFTDKETLLTARDRMVRRFGFSRVVMVVDRGMIIEATIKNLRESDGVDWITALKSQTLSKLDRLKDPEHEQTLSEIRVHPDFPDESREPVLIAWCSGCKRHRRWSMPTRCRTGGGVHSFRTLDVEPGMIYEDRTSGAHGDKPGPENWLRALRDGDVLVVLKLDRLGATSRTLSASSRCCPRVVSA